MVPGESNLKASTPGFFFTHKPETAVSSVATNMLTSGPAGGCSHPKGPFVGDCWWGGKWPIDTEDNSTRIYDDSRLPGSRRQGASAGQLLSQQSL